MPSREAPVVFICGDVGTGSVPLRLGELAAQLCRELSGTAPLVLPEICEVPEALVVALATSEPRRVVIGCRAASRRGELLARLRRAGVSPAGTVIVDLQTADGCTEKIALEQSVVLLRAAVARVASADLHARVKERTSLSLGGVSRRSLLRGVNTARRFVAVWRQDRCTGGAACTACVLACPHGALHRESGRVIVDGDRCTGCGVCAAVCRNGALALPGAEVDGLRAEADVLVAAIRRHRSAKGVAIVCQHAKSVPGVGGPWLTLRVPSIEIVTAGWILQLVGAGVGVTAIACEDKDCEVRLADLGQFVRDLGEGLGFSAGRPAGGRTLVSQLSVPAVPASGVDHIELREPEATAQSLKAFGALGPGRTPWRAEGPGCSLGVVTVDPAGCSLCEVCVGVCPTGALRTDRNGAGLLRLSVDTGRCTACKACVIACPETVIALDRAVDGVLMAAGRQVVATGPAVSCETCGAPLVAGLSPGELRRRLGGSHPNLTAGTSRICADCRLGGRSVTASRSVPNRRSGRRTLVSGPGADLRPQPRPLPEGSQRSAAT